jgi:hypothetical protein
MNQTPQTQIDICTVCDELKELLLQKNKRYGDSALSPIRVFSKSDNLEQIRVRLDDKLSRLRNAQDDEDEDVVTDLIGYLVLYKVALARDKQEQASLEQMYGVHCQEAE